MGVEILGMKTAINAPEMTSETAPINGEDEEALKVDELEHMMRKMQAVKGMAD